MSEIIAYGFRRNAKELEELGASVVYLDHDGKRRDRSLMIEDLRVGDVVRVFYLSDLGGPQWPKWKREIENKGATLEEHRPETPPKPPGRPNKYPMTDRQLADAREAWLHPTNSLDERLADVGIAIGRKLSRADRHWLYGRFGKPDAPKEPPAKED